MTATAELRTLKTPLAPMFIPQDQRTFHAVGDRVVLRPDESGGEQKVGSLVIPEVAREKPQEATVTAIGPTADVPGLVVGSRVLYGKYSGTEVTVDGVDYLILHAKDLLLVFG